MAEPTENEGAHGDGGLAAAARDRGMEELESAKGRLAENAERVAAAVDRTADELEGEGGDALSGFGHSAASLMRQLAGGLRERDVEQFARELGALARRNPGVFLAGCVALGFGIARFFKARPAGYDGRGYAGESNAGWQDDSESWRSGSESSQLGAESWQSAASWQSSGSSQTAGEPQLDEDAEESLDLSATEPRRDGDNERARNSSRPRGGKQKARAQRASAGGSQQPGSEGHAPSTERPSTDRPTAGEGGAGTDSAFTGGTGGGALRGGKS